MAHFAEINEANIVLRVLVIPDAQEHRGQDFLANDLKLNGRWIQTSYNNKMRVRFAGIGYRYDETRDAFIPPQPYVSWVFNEETLDWKAPVDYPTDGEDYYWNETIQNWIPITEGNI